MGFQLEIEDVKLRDKKWVEFIQSEPDRDAVADQFYQFIGKASKIKKFKAGQAELILELDFDKYLKINEHRELEEEKRQGVDENTSSVVGQKRHRATLSHDHPSSRTRTDTGSVRVYTVEAPIPLIPAALPQTTFPNPALLPPSLHLETLQKAVKITSQPSKINQGTVCISFQMCRQIKLIIFSSVLLLNQDQLMLTRIQPFPGSTT